MIVSILQTKKKRRNEDEIVEKSFVSGDRRVLCLGSVGVTGMQSVLESVGTVLSVSAEGTDEWKEFLLAPEQQQFV